VNLRQRIDELIEEHDTYRAIADATGVDICYLHKLRDGTKDNPSNATCERLGLKKRMMIEYTKF